MYLFQTGSRNRLSLDRYWTNSGREKHKP